MTTTVQTAVRGQLRTSPMSATALVPGWWMVATRGALAMAFGGTLSLWPNPTLPFVVVLFAVYAILDGGWAIGAAAAVSRHGRRRLETWPIVLEGAVSILIGAVALWWPFVPRPFVEMVAMWGIITGALELLTAFALPRQLAAHWLMATSGICSVFLAVLIMLVRRADVMVYVIASYAIVFGVLTMSAAVWFRNDMTRSLRPSVQ